MKYILILFLFSGYLLQAQPLNRKDKKMVSWLKETVGFLADDRLEGRRTGTPGEELAYRYISQQFNQIGLEPLGDQNGYIQPFDVYDGRAIDSVSSLFINDVAQTLHTGFFPMAYSGNVSNLLLPSFSDPGVELIDLKDALAEQKSNPHFDLKDFTLNRCRDAEKSGKKLVIISNSSAEKDDLKFEPMDKTTRLGIPVIYINGILNTADLVGSEGDKPNHKIRLTVSIRDKKRTGHNIVGYINNNAAQTIVLGAHYDHLGYGEDKNSLYAGTSPMIHNGADDNASGTAALIALGKKIKSGSLKKYNYLFVSFSGEELGLYGSKYFTEHSPVNLKDVNFMINMDMVGRLNDSTRGLTVGGYGTSPSWQEVIRVPDDYFTIKIDSSGSGPSDHTSFYRKDIPVLFFFTGTHSDYHKPSDDADKINYTGQLSIIKYIYRVLEWAENKEKLAFTKTREAASTGKSSFKVSLGIMPDYTFSGTGVHVDGISEGKAAQKAGIKTGDVIIQLGPHKVTDVQEYMQVLAKFNKGDATTVKIKRGTEELELPIQF